MVIIMHKNPYTTLKKYTKMKNKKIVIIPPVTIVTINMFTHSMSSLKKTE